MSQVSGETLKREWAGPQHLRTCNCFHCTQHRAYLLATARPSPAVFGNPDEPSITAVQAYATAAQNLEAWRAKIEGK